MRAHWAIQGPAERRERSLARQPPPNQRPLQPTVKLRIAVAADRVSGAGNRRITGRTRSAARRDRQLDAGVARVQWREFASGLQ